MAMGYLRTVGLSPRQRRIFWLAAALLTLSALTALALVQMKPILTRLASARVANSVNRIMVAAVNEAIATGDIDYGNLVSFEKDYDGRITALRSNMAEVNRLQNEIADDVLQRLSQVSTSELSIPLGTLTGFSLLAGRGPSLKVRMQTVGTTTAAFRDAFTAAGINQTRHRIVLQLDAYMSILLPGFSTYTKVSNEITVAETVIVGSVPESYTYFQGQRETTDEYAEEYIMNIG
ncbi:MAG: sporulation protein YunB [Oscillospiraceae bacterium]|nr:sporulation protein YunB [Oscillospiraceae bacterium]MBQ7465363.1 sporulation protein YunB [Oscillospiraceae bacterium]